MKKWDELSLKVKIRRYERKHHSVPPNWKPPINETEVIPIPEELIGLEGPELLLALKRYVESNT